MMIKQIFIWFEFLFQKLLIKYLQLTMDWRNKPHQIFNKIKQQMFSKGIDSFFIVDELINSFDPQNTGRLTKHFLNIFLNKLGVFLSTQEIRTLRDVYPCPIDSESVIYGHFLRDVRYSFDERVVQSIEQAWEKLSSKGSQITLDYLENTYNFGQHPDVLTRRRFPNEVNEAFLKAISRKLQKHIITKQGFYDYYSELNFCIPLERTDFFVQVIRGTWSLKEQKNYISPKRIHEMELIVFQKIRQKSDGKTNQWKCGKKALHFFDLGDTGTCDLVGFRQGLDKFGCTFNEHQIKALFRHFDTNKSGLLEYQQFSKLLMNIDINGMVSKPNLLTTLGTNYFRITH